MSLLALTQPYVDALQKSNDVKRWRLYGSKNEFAVAGFSKINVADIYQPARQQRSTYLTYAIELAGGIIAYGSLNPTQTSPETMLELAKITGVKSEDSLSLAPTTSESSLPRLISDNGFEPQLLSKLLPEATTLRDKLLATNPKSFEGDLRGNHSQCIYRDSNDLTLTDDSVSYKAEFDYNGRIESAYTTREYSDLMPNLNKSIDSLLPYIKHIDQKVVTPDESRLPVFMIHGTELIDLYLLDHLGGLRVDSGSSRFKIEDFKNQLQVASTDLTLSFDQTRDMHIDSASFSDEGIVGQKFTLIDQGKLTEPLCGLKASQRLGYDPHLSVSTDEALFSQIPTYAELSKSTGTYLLILHAMGTHTQNTMLGTYSLPCPECLYFKDGELVGPAKPVITGNFFDVMKSGSMQVVSSDLSQEPMLYFETDVTFS